MYIAVVDRDRFLAEVLGGKEIPQVRGLHAVTLGNAPAPALMIHYEIYTEPRGEKIRLVHNELVPARHDGEHWAADIAGSLLDQMQRAGLVYEVELKDGSLTESPS